MTEKELIDLGFQRNDVSAEESGNENDFYYYTYDFDTGISLISNANDEIKDGEWYVNFFDNYKKVTYAADTIQKLIDAIKTFKTFKK